MIGKRDRWRVYMVLMAYLYRDDKANMGIVALRSKDTVSEIFGDAPGGGGSLVRRARAKTIRPVWHAPWKLMRVISGHLGWVRAVTVEPGNKWFATGAGDRTIKVILLQRRVVYIGTHGSLSIDLGSCIWHAQVISYWSY